MGTCCAGQCVDRTVDPSNCGLCGVECPSEICAPYGFLSQDLLLLGMSICLPVSPSSDCRATCGPDMFCLEGTCIPVMPAFGRGPCLAADGTVGISCANGACSHPLDDPQNCGACGNACPPGVLCSAGACAGSECGSRRWGNFCGDGGERTCCPGADCTDIQTDSSNCGDCGRQCPPGTACRAGACG